MRVRSPVANATWVGGCNTKFLHVVSELLRSLVLLFSWLNDKLVNAKPPNHTFCIATKKQSPAANTFHKDNV